MNKIIKIFKLNINNDYLVKKIVAEIKENGRRPIDADLAEMMGLILGINIATCSLKIFKKMPESFDSFFYTVLVLSLVVFSIIAVLNRWRILHTLLIKGKKEREIDIDNTTSSHIIRKQYTQDDLKEFLDKKFSDKSIKKFIYERVVLESGLDTSLLTYIELVPYRKLERDHLKLVLAGNKLRANDTILSIDNNLINFAFNKYSSQQLCRLLTTNFSYSEYKKVLEFIQNHNQIELPVVNNFKSLIDFTFYGKENFIEPTKDLSGDCILGRIKRVQGGEQLFYVAEMFKNCLKSKMKQCLNGSLVIYYIDDVLVFSVNSKGNLVELKGYINKNVSVEERNIILSYINKKGLS